MPAASFQTDTSGINPGLKLLITLRWLALGGQVGLCLFSRYYLEMLLPWAVLLPCMAVTTVTNIAATLWRNKNFIPEKTLCGVLLFLDTAILTVMLFWTGGAHNPFATFYLLHIAIATILLPGKAPWFLVFVASACYALLFTSSHTLTSLSAHEFCGSLDFHVQGMLLAMILVGIGLVFFSGQLQAKLARKEAELKQAQMSAARNERFAALATLSAGVAHELATPLGTIAIVSEELAEQAGSNCLSKGCLADAQLIRSEVQRCCEVIEKLRQQTTDGLGEPIEELAVSAIPQLLEGHLKPEHFKRLHFDNQCTAAVICAPQTALLQALAVLIKNGCQSAAADTPIELGVRQSNGQFIFAVKDRGEGMPPETIARLGEPFFTTKAPGQGIGLGLFLVRMFVERTQGRLNVHSAPGEGTTIELIVPIHESPVY